jgi:hypothetical protein
MLAVASTVCVAAVAVSQAEPRYVIEQLVVSVSSEPGGGEKVASIKSGDQVELLEKQGGDVHVRLANGTEGWVRASYLSTEEPLQKRLNERTAEVEKLKQDVSQLEAQLAATRKPDPPESGRSAAPLSVTPPAVPTPANPATPAPPATPPAATAPPASIPDPTWFMTAPEEPARPVWHWVLGSSLLTLAAGFGLGWWVLDRRIRRKYGGLRIY